MDDTFDWIDMILHELNSDHANIKFTYKLESYNKLGFLDVYARRSNDNKAEISVYRKATCTNNYINWHSYAPSNWKIGTSEILKKEQSQVLPNFSLEMKLVIYEISLQNITIFHSKSLII